uniref:CCHC-type domain-containing protein n=1 Tax=Trichuris muris TaxID=70415 RepID=A0A5S6QG77_TRIMR
MPAERNSHVRYLYNGRSGFVIRRFLIRRISRNVSTDYLYMATLQRTFHQLCKVMKKQLGFEVPEKVLLLRITSTIPPEHKTVRQIWDATPSAERNLSDFIECVQMAEKIDTFEKDHTAAFSMKCATDVKKGLSNATGRKRLPFKCRKCGKRGHMAEKCRSIEKGNKNSTKGLIASVFTSFSRNVS